MSGVITGVRVTHETASVDTIDEACRPDGNELIETLLAREGVTEAFALQTCNRSEAYVVSDDIATGRRALGPWTEELPDGAATWSGHEESLRHLLRVAAGLDSLVVGEDQIIGQLKEAYAEARGIGALGEILDDALLKAIHVGERARTETAINEGVVSLGSAAVSLITGEREIDGASALVIGAGEMGTLAAQALSRYDLSELVVANRTRSRAERIAEELPVNAEARSLDGLETVLSGVDVVIAATGSDEPVLDAGTFDPQTCVVDLAKPRDIERDSETDASVTLYDLDDLETVTERTAAKRAAAASTVETMIDRELEHLLGQFKRKQADDAISGMYEGAQHIKRSEVTTALAKLESQGGLTDDQRETVEAMADALVGQLLSAPTKSLREAAAEDDWETINTAIQLFDPTEGATRAETIGPDSSEGVPPEVAARIEDD
ncbi:glutamyl-tRNA reductase [Halalkalicoccus jeotgali]|uniref:Glutamyl-tRNA reductase n=1 Tax=Halalkalicoccus jeotgali (strain DSM 18796 / CECT 7217 / JCM 14584 / KCTC 4019 / B3) TaxID=795797 RepID=D8JA91_HALJB|nr:glutamyl-tRNA reductase [Halalkalicoccus jeotgali]ADJ14613.1 glutamyl-tRNA reductase [Halalkalicoccus jeotgali B3]ELY39986.1 glutamyl-tRNA reductase [Halalkalicoccus jeotgali B3]